MATPSTTADNVKNIDELIASARAHHRARRMRHAQAAYRSALALAPTHPAANHGLGMLILQDGRPAEALSMLKMALEMAPAHADHWLSYLDALIQATQFVTARHVLAQARNQGLHGSMLDAFAARIDQQTTAAQTVPSPSYSNTATKSARQLEALMASGNQTQARKAAEAMTRSHPDHPAAWAALGALLSEAGDHAGACAALSQVAERRPDDADALNNLGLAQRAAGQAEAACALHRRAALIAPKRADIFHNLGGALWDMRKFDEALVAFREALALSPKDALMHKHLAVVSHELGQLDIAQHHFLQAIELNPGLADAYAGLGTTLLELGDMAKAGHYLGKGLELAPDSLTTLGAALLYLPYRPEDLRFSQLEALYASRNRLAPADRVKLGFAMGRAMESIGDYDRAFLVYEEANGLHYAQHPYDDEADEYTVVSACEFFTNELFEQCAMLAKRLPVENDPRIPIFIVGMPRSGTSLIEQILASHENVFGAGELPTLGNLAKKAIAILREDQDEYATLSALKALGREYLDTVWRMAPHARYITDKMPGNYYYLWLVQLALPQARIVHSIRDAMDTCFSCYSLPFKAEYRYAYDLRALGRRYLRYQRLMQHWRTALPYGCVFDMHYEKLVAEPEAQTRALLNYLGLPWDERCLRFYENTRAVHTSSVVQVRKPIYTASIARWKRFEKYLGPLQDTLRESSRQYNMSHLN